MKRTLFLACITAAVFFSQPHEHSAVRVEVIGGRPQRADRFSEDAVTL